MVLVHGYNNEWRKVQGSYDTLSKRMGKHGLIGPAGPLDLVVGFTWPGGRWAASYLAARRRAKKVAPRLAGWLEKMMRSAASVDLNTHSMGARVALECLQDERAQVRVRNLTLLGAAVDDESIQQGHPFFEATQACDRVHVFHSKHDSVLGGWYRLGDGDDALGWKGPEDTQAIVDHSQNVKIINCKQVVESHSGYKDASEIYRYLLDEHTGPMTPQFVTLRKAAARSRVRKRPDR